MQPNTYIDGNQRCVQCPGQPTPCLLCTAALGQAIQMAHGGACVHGTSVTCAPRPQSYICQNDNCYHERVYVQCCLPVITAAVATLLQLRVLSCKLWKPVVDKLNNHR
jgi:hypothetical protein